MCETEPGSLQMTNKMFQKLQQGDEKINCFNQKAVLLLGNSGAGKTTSSYILMNKELIGANQYGQTVYKYKCKFENAEIGHTNDSCTQIPNTFSQDDNILIDCPGFLDSFKFDRNIINAYYIYRIFSNSKKLKFIFTCNEEGFSGKAREFLESIKCFLNMFNFDNEFTAKQLVKSTVLLVTKSHFQDINSITKLLKMLIDKPPRDIFKEKQKAYVEILQNWINNKNIFFIKKAEADTPSPKNTLLKEIHDKTEYWERKVGNDGISQMDHIHFQIDQKNMELQEIELSKKAFNVCSDTLKDLAKVLAGALQQIQQNILDDSQKYKFYEEWRSQMKKIVSFKENEVDYSKLTRYKQNHLRRIKMIQLTHNIIQSLTGKKDQQDRLILTKTSMNKLIQYIIQYIIQTPQQQKIVSQFSYLVKRKFQEIKILEKLSDKFEKLRREALDFLIGFSGKDYSQIEKYFALQYKLKQNKSIEYYTQVIEFLSKYKDQKPVLKKIQIAQRTIGRISQAQNNKKQALLYYIKAIKNSEIINQDDNKEYYVKVDKSLYRKVADVLLEIQNYEYALKFYMVINQVAKIGVCYDQIFKKMQKQEDKIQNRIKKGDYLREMTLLEQAIDSYHQALSIASQQSQFLQSAANKIIEAHQKRDQDIKQLKQKWKRKEYYRKLEPNFKLDQIIQELGKTS